MTRLRTSGLTPSTLRASKLRGVHSWARIVVPMAGLDCGTYCLPKPDDQVLVVFEHGNINRPLVIGPLWSSWSKGSVDMEDVRRKAAAGGRRKLLVEGERRECVALRRHASA